MIHIPVLTQEVLKYLDVGFGKNYIDGTVGSGGHSEAILKATGLVSYQQLLTWEKQGKLLGIDQDPEILQVAQKRLSKFGKRLELIQGSFSELKNLIKKSRFSEVRWDGILLDLGLSSWHLQQSGRGFSFQRDEPLDMRFNPRGALTAEMIINNWPQLKIEMILKQYGQERFAKRIAEALVKQRKIQKIETTFQLVEIIKRAVPSRFQKSKIHPATRTFQALRIAVNQELDNLEKGLNQAAKVVSSGGRLVVIAYHSLEDRIVKKFFKNCSFLKNLTPKPIRPNQEEIRQNPRSRSAKLRAAEVQTNKTAYGLHAVQVP